jgi:hypothetical protein
MRAVSPSSTLRARLSRAAADLLLAQFRLDSGPCATDLVVQLRQCAGRRDELAFHGADRGWRARHAVVHFPLKILHGLSPGPLPVLEHGTKLIAGGAAR